MLKSNFVKCFSRSIKINYTNNALNRVKNLIYFASERELNNNSSLNQISIALKNIHESKIADIKKNKIDIIYPLSEESFFQRLCYVSTSVNDPEQVRSIASKALRTMLTYNLKEINIMFSETYPIHFRRIVLNSLILANYQFKRKSKLNKNLNKLNSNSILNDENEKDLQLAEEINILEDHLTRSDIKSLTTWTNLAKAALHTRELANERPNIANCDFLEEEAFKIGSNTYNKDKIRIEVIKGEELKEKKLNLIYSVGKSATTKPRLLILQYIGDETTTNVSHAIVGKGLTFDTGGLNLKPTNYIEDMYQDKHGACNSLSVFKAVTEMNWKINLVCVLAIAENSIDGDSYKPSDIIESYKGLTVEITNTDAEGRLVLADALSYVQEKYKPQNIINLATLTGACMVALGHKTAGLFTNNEHLAKEVIKAGQ